MIDNDDLKGAERPQKPKGLKSLLGGLFAKKEAEDDLENEAFSGERSSYQGTGASGGKDSGVPASAIMRTGRNNLEVLRRTLARQPVGNLRNFPVLYNTFTYRNIEPDLYCRIFIDQQQNEAGEVLKDLSLSEAAGPGNRGQGAEMAMSRRGSCNVGVSKDKMAAWAFLFPPINGGAEVTEGDILQELRKNGVSFGVDDAMIQHIVRGKVYLQAVEIAHGIPPVDGEDGSVIDRISREHSASASLREDGTVDYRDLNWIRHIREGDVICDIILPTEAVPGKDVSGDTVQGRDGSPAKVPMGKNTTMNEAGTALVAAVDGHVSFSNGRFTIINLLTIPGDVDNSVGNIDMLGDVVIKGDVLDRFIIKATGNVVIQGILEGATIIAGGNIQIYNGMNGNGHGMLDAKGDITCKFLENCTVQCGGKLFSESLINCTVTANDLVNVTSGRGVIIGGTIMACNSVEAKIIGNRSHRTTTIIIGTTPSILMERDQIVTEVERLQRDREELEKNVSYLERNNAEDNVQMKALYTQMKLRLSVVRMQYSVAQKKLEKLDNQRRDMSKCFVKAGDIYPITHVTVSRESTIISTQTKMCNIHCDDSGLVLY